MAILKNYSSIVVPVIITSSRGT
ncbi:hypothetical protein VCHENC02_0801, partial [Vibrio harveyi]